MLLARFVFLVLLLSSPPMLASDWSRFRGPNGSGVSEESQQTPTTWSPTENLKWKTPLPGAGVSSPIVIGDRAYVTCYSGYGMQRNDPGNMEDLKRHLICIDIKDGNIVWDTPVDAVLPEDPYQGAGVPAHGYASHSPVSDGQRIYVFFGKTGALAFDLDGKKLWQTSVGTESDPRRWGSASSPILYKDMVIITASSESQSLYGLNKETGEVVWHEEAAGIDNVWGTPALVKVDDERTDLVLGVPYEIWGFNPETGKLRWYVEANQSDQFNSSIVVADGVIYSIEGRGGGSIAVRAGGSKNATESHVVWSGRDSGRFATPVVHDGRIYSISGNIAKCIDALTGDQIYQKRLQGESSGGNPAGGDQEARQGGGRQGGFGGGGGGGFGGGGRGGFGRRGGADYSSPILADGKIYYVRGSGDIFVLKAGDGFEQLAVNRVTEDSETFAATPAVSNGQLFIRSDKHLYCVGE